MAEMATREHTNESVLVEEDGATTMVESEDADMESLTKSLEIEDVDSSESNGPFSVKTWMEDLTLEVEGRNLYVSKMALATACPGFRKIFEETISTEKIVLNGKKYEDFLEFLLCVYPNPDTLKKINENNVMTVVPLIVEYQVVNLLETCDTFVGVQINDTVTLENLLFYLGKAFAYGLDKSKKKCLSMLTEKDIEAIEQSRVFGEFPPQLKVELLGSMAKIFGKQVVKQTEALKNYEELKKCFLAFFPRQERATMASYTTCGSIQFSFNPTSLSDAVLKSESVNCGESALCVHVNKGKTEYSRSTDYLFAELVFLSEKKSHYVKYDLVNNFSNKDNVKCSESNKKVSIIQWSDLIDESKGFLRDGTVILNAHFLF